MRLIRAVMCSHERPERPTEPPVRRSCLSRDILFIDSSHVVKTGSDVNHLLFEVLPRLRSGVLIQFHGIFHPFEYPKDWVLGGFNWNEDYFIRAFLMHNQAYSILLFANYLHKVHPSVFDDMPLCRRNRGGSLWLEKC